MSVANDDMVEEINAHCLACLLHVDCEPVIILAWHGIVGGMVMNEHDDGGIVEQCILHDYPNIHSGFSNAALREPDLLDEFVVIV